MCKLHFASKHTDNLCRWCISQFQIRLKVIYVAHACSLASLQSMPLVWTLNHTYDGDAESAHPNVAWAGHVVRGPTVPSQAPRGSPSVSDQGSQQVDWPDEGGLSIDGLMVLLVVLADRGASLVNQASTHSPPGNLAFISYRPGLDTSGAGLLLGDVEHTFFSCNRYPWRVVIALQWWSVVWLS